jgi:ABC-type transporter Mla MlaB component
MLERCTVVLDGVVTQESALDVTKALALLQPGGTLLLDLSRARDVQGATLAHLVRLFDTRGASLTVRILGLRERDCRILRYLGFELDRTGRPVWSSDPGALDN